MPPHLLTTIDRIIAWLIILVVAACALASLWLLRHQPIEMDVAMMHYSAYLINEKNLLLYRDIFENNFPGPFFFHALIGKTLGYEAHAVRLVDAAILICFAILSWLILAPLSKRSAVLAPSLFSIIYFLGGTVCAFQRDYIAALPIAAALAVVCRRNKKHCIDSAMVGGLCGLACGFKPNFIVALPAFLWILLLRSNHDWKRFFLQVLAPACAAFTIVFIIPFIWGLQHADLNELLALYKTYTPIYVSTRPDLYHYDNKQQQLIDLALMQGKHLLTMSLLSIPGLLWASRLLREKPEAMQRLLYLMIILFAISWHELIAGKYWPAHLLAPYFFGVLCLSLLAKPFPATERLIWKYAHLLIIILLGTLIIPVSLFVTYTAYNKHYDADNFDIRSKKIARYLVQNIREGDKVQSLDGSGDGQGSLLLAKATTATRFVEDIPLYLQPKSPVTQAFRREFMDAMQQDPPAFFIYIHNFFHPAGGNRLKEFKELNAFLDEKYIQAELVDGEYTIYALKRPAR